MDRSTQSTLLIIVTVALAVMGFVYFFTQPRTVEDRLDSAGNALSNGNLGQAVQEMGNETQGEKIQNDVENAVDNATGQ